MRARLLVLGATGAALATVVVSGPSSAPSAGAQATGEGDLRLLGQTVQVPPAEGTPISFRLDVALADLGTAAGGEEGTTDGAGAGGFVITVRAHDPVPDRTAFDRVLQGQLPPVYDYVDVPLSPEVTTASEGSTAPGRTTIEVSVPLEIEDRTVEALRLSDPGVYPIELAVQDADGDPTATVLTFVEREPDPAADPTASDRLDLGLVASVDGGPAHRPDGTISVPDAARAQLLRLLALLEAFPEVPVTTTLRPELLDGMARSGDPADADLLARLRTTSGSVELLAAPYVRLDPSAAQRAGLADTFTEQLRLGEDVTAEVLPGVVTRRTAWIADRALDGAGAQLLRDLGIRAAVLTPPTQLEIADGGPIFADPTLQFGLQLPSGSTMPATDIDLRLAERLTQPTDAPFPSAVRLYAELAVIRTEVLGRGEPLTGRSLVIATTDTSPADPATLLPLVELLLSSGRFELVPLTAAVATTDEMLVDGRPLTFELPATAGPDLTELAAELGRYSYEAGAMASMLPSGDPRPERWSDVLDLLPAEAWSDTDRAELTSTIDADTEEIASALVLPPATTFTLGGRQADIVIGIRNEGDTELRAEVRLRSSKLTFPEGQQTEAFPPDELTRVSVPVEARTNGQFPVTVELVTPVGDLVLGPPVVLTARVNALTGLGQLVSGAALLVLATWWVHHLRVRRRQRRAEAAEAAIDRHPATAGSPNGVPAKGTTLSDP